MIAKSALKWIEETLSGGNIGVQGSVVDRWEGDLKQQGQQQVLDDVEEEKHGDEGIALDFESKHPLDLKK